MTELKTVGNRLPSTTLRRWLFFFVFLACLIPPALVLTKIVSEGVNTPFLDQWETSFNIALDTLDGTLAFDSIIAFHNEHRIFFTNLLTVFSARFLHWNLYLELFVTVALAVALLALLMWMIRRDFPEITLAVLVPVSALVFSLRGGHTWMTSFQSCFLWVTLFFLLGLAVLRHKKVGWLPLITATICAVAATFSLASGLISWFVLGLGLPLLGYRKARYLLFWFIAAVVCLVIYYGSQRPQTHFDFTPDNLLRLVEYTLVYLSSILIPITSDSAAQAVPVVLLSILLFLANIVYLWRRGKSWKQIVPWWLIAGYALATAALTGMGRLYLFSGFPYQALSERYVIIAAMWWIGLVVLGAAVVHIALQQGKKQLVGVGIAVVNLLALGVVATLFIQASVWNETCADTVSPDTERCYGQYLITQDDTLPCLPIVRMDHPERWLPRVNVLSMRRLAMFNMRQLDISLDQLPYTVLDVIYGAPEPHYETFARDGVTLPALFERADALIEYNLSLPEWYTGAEFVASLYLDPINVLKDPERQQDGVIFSVIAIGEDGQVRRSEAVVFDPHINTELIPFAFDLSDFLGQRVRLQLQTEGRETLDYDWALWVDPRIRLSD